MKGVSVAWKLGIVGILAVLIAVAYLLLFNRLPVPIVLPVPNGYDDFVQAAHQAVQQRDLKFGEASVTELRELIAQNRPALALAREGLKRRSRVATDYHLSQAVYAAQHMPLLADFKKLALAFRAEGEFAERQGHTNDAARVYLDGMRFGQEVCRGGLLIDRLVGIACERIAFDPLQSLVPELGAPVCRELARDLEQIDAGREPIQATWQEEHRWATHVSGVRERIILMLRPKFLQAARANAATKLASLQLRERGLMLELAARAYQLEHGNGSARAADLVPGYLQTIPKHPLTGKEMQIE